MFHGRFEKARPTSIRCGANSYFKIMTDGRCLTLVGNTTGSFVNSSTGDNYEPSLESQFQGTIHAFTALLKHVGVNHCGGEVLVP
jgi:hypothetical protein